MCVLCGHDPCVPLRKAIADDPELREAMTADDWQDIYNFIRYVQLPFIHAICVRALERSGLE